MRRRIRPMLSLGFAGLAFVLWWRVNQGPYFLRWVLIALEHYQCDKCGSLDGGIYGKGPVERLRTDSGHWCVHDWRPTSGDEFRRLASERFGMDRPPEEKSRE